MALVNLLNCSCIRATKNAVPHWLPTDYLKCPLPLGWAISNLVLSALEFKPAYDAAGQWGTALNVIRWGADWMMKAHITASDTPAANVFVGQVRLGVVLKASSNILHRLDPACKCLCTFVKASNRRS